jgi:hypothetical protein
MIIIMENLGTLLVKNFLKDFAFRLIGWAIFWQSSTNPIPANIIHGTCKEK